MERNKVVHRTPRRFRDARIFRISVEGEQTETLYFEWLDEELGSPRLQLEVLAPSSTAATADTTNQGAPHAKPGASSPRAVAERLMTAKPASSGLRADEWWVVVDFDRWERQLIDIARQQAQGRFQLAVSRPAFESWLLLHFGPLPDDLATLAAHDATKRCAQQLREHGGSYNKKNGLPPGALTLERVAQAVNRARQLAKDDGDQRWPQRPGSHVYKLVWRILEVAAYPQTPPHVH